MIMTMPAVNFKKEKERESMQQSKESNSKKKNKNPEQQWNISSDCTADNDKRCEFEKSSWLNLCATMHISAGYEECNGASWKFYNTSLTWTEAEFRCAVDGAHLAIVRTNRDRECWRGFIQALELTCSKRVWVGFTDQLARGQYIWSDGQKSDTKSLPWASRRRRTRDQVREGQYYTPPSRKCGFSFANSSSGFLGDAKCKRKLMFMCQRKGEKERRLTHWEGCIEKHLITCVICHPFLSCGLTFGAV